MNKQFYVYIMTNPKHRTLYTGVTSNLPARVFEHKEKITAGFTSRYNINMLVYYEEQADAPIAIAREKQLKGGSRQDKINLINGMNPGWCDLSEHLS
jgi:putative endonuclease